MLEMLQVGSRVTIITCGETGTIVGYGHFPNPCRSELYLVELDEPLVRENKKLFVRTIPVHPTAVEEVV